MTPTEILDVCKEQVYEAWLRARSSAVGDDVAAFVYESSPKEIKILVAPRESLVERLVSEGVDFSEFPEVKTKATDDNPIPAIALWVIVGVDVEKRTVYVTKFVEPLFGRMGGTVMGQA